MKTKMVFFDMDGVITREKSSWHYVHSRLGVDNSQNYKMYMDGKISYDEFFELDIKMWMAKFGKIKKSTIINILDEIKIRNCFDNVMSSLRKMSVKTAIVSGGISWLAEKIGAKYGINYVYANEILTDDNGYIIPAGRISVIPDRKDIVINKIIRASGIDKKETLSVGDSAGDYSMLVSTDRFLSINSDDKILNENAFAVINNLGELLNYL
ncbi:MULTISPECIES: HAD-IB family phosphatase [Acidiplasma]|uniref:phosphoserine phosphatase n=1 Tax=Acidiplasma aeolicum TaxID=507754 RepID=A0A0Q0XJ23_9ARCH|nr:MULTISPECIES: HAD-IB family phosphatase [Acidiplasma]KQB34851.1 hypothetical protein AOG54_03575 [Acidiplasma aeolicum]WMT55069.1 MAG: HAD-IB family phosphatase [Acidiplasma sp.]